jgi:hypothetical protein
MGKLMRSTLLAAAFVAGASVAWAKLPSPPPMDDKAKAAAEEKKAKDAAAAEKAKADLAAATDKMIKNRDANLKQAGKPIPKPTPVVAAAPAPAAAGAAKPADKAGTAPAKAPDKKG